MMDRKNKQTRIINKFHSYKYGAKTRHLSFNISFEHFRKLISSKCFYCEYLNVLNGIDRLNNNRGYEIDNCVPCCSICNQMKMCLNWRVFIDRAAKIIEVDNNRNLETRRHD